MCRTINWSHFQSPRLLWLPPGGQEDVIAVAPPNRSAYGAGFVEFELISDPSVRWWKGLIPVASNGQRMGISETQDDIHTGAVLVHSMASLRDAKLQLWKAKAFGAHTCMYELNINSMPAAWSGTRITFNWFRDNG